MQSMLLSWLRGACPSCEISIPSCVTGNKYIILVCRYREMAGVPWDRNRKFSARQFWELCIGVNLFSRFLLHLVERWRWSTNVEEEHHLKSFIFHPGCWKETNDLLWSSLFVFYKRTRAINTSLVHTSKRFTFYAKALIYRQGGGALILFILHAWPAYMT